MVAVNEIETFIVRNLRAHPRDIARFTADHFGYSRQGVNRHLKVLVDTGLIVPVGRTKARTYSLATLLDERSVVKLEDLEEHVVWRDTVARLVGEDTENVRRISEYGFTEILNNAIVHSAGSEAAIHVTCTAAHIRYDVWDDGIGIFRKIKEECHLEDERHSILELAKGKLTTDPSRHSGEGIFFTTRSFDMMSIASGELAFIHRAAGDWLMEDPHPTKGTFVSMEIDRFTTRTLREVFDRYTSGEDDYGFTKTQVPVSLAKYGDENLVSRSQAKRVVARLDRFKEVVFDFEGVSRIGQAFADEIFRVFWASNPEMHLLWINANPEVVSMIRRALDRGAPPLSL